MSAPDTNTERQAKRHKVPLIGIAAAVAVALVVGVVLMGVLNEAGVSGEANDVNPVADEAVEQN
jgi:hypothetical protein